MRERWESEKRWGRDTFWLDSCITTTHQENLIFHVWNAAIQSRHACEMSVQLVLYNAKNALCLWVSMPQRELTLSYVKWVTFWCVPILTLSLCASLFIGRLLFIWPRGSAWWTPAAWGKYSRIWHCRRGITWLAGQNNQQSTDGWIFLVNY